MKMHLTEKITWPTSRGTTIFIQKETKSNFVTRDKKYKFHTPCKQCSDLSGKASHKSDQ